MKNKDLYSFRVTIAYRGVHRDNEQSEPQYQQWQHNQPAIQWDLLKLWPMTRLRTSSGSANMFSAPKSILGLSW